MEIYEDQIVIPHIARTASVDSDWQRAFGANGLYACLHVSAAGTGTLALRLHSKEPFEFTPYTLNVDVTITSANRHEWVFMPGVARQPDGEAAATLATIVRQVVAIPLPDTWRIHIEKSDSSSWTFGVAVRRVP